ncbi:MAG: Lpg1974 family pore-forming outer membrane protein [Simkaniaceae bacterium]
MKKFFLFFFIATYTSSVIANSTLSSSTSTTSEDYQSGFYLKLTGAALLPSETGIGSFTDSWQYTSDGGIRSLSKPSKADYKFACGALVGYDASSLPNFVEAEYFYLSNSKHNYNDTSDNPISFGSIFFNVGLPLTPGQEFVSDAYLKYRLNQVDARAGHRFFLADNHLELSPSIGIRWADLKHNLTFLVGHVRTSYWGVGPAFALDGLYTLYKGLKLYSHFDATLLVGGVKANSLLNFFGVSKYESPSTNRVVPTVGGKLALRYDFTFKNKSSLRIEAGYQVATYIGVFDSLTGFLEIPQIQVQRIASITTNNFSYSGPYAAIAFHM